MDDEISAADDPRTARHEKSKDRFFYATIGGAIVVSAAGILIATQGKVWVLVGIALFLMGTLMGTAAILGFLYRGRARRTLSAHPWRRVPVTILHRPAPGRRGRLIVQTTDSAQHAFGITGVGEEFIAAATEAGALEYAGDLDQPGMLFARLPDGENVYVAMVSSRSRSGDDT